MCGSPSAQPSALRPFDRLEAPQAQGPPGEGPNRTIPSAWKSQTETRPSWERGRLARILLDCTDPEVSNRDSTAALGRGSGCMVSYAHTRHTARRCHHDGTGQGNPELVRGRQSGDAHESRAAARSRAVGRDRQADHPAGRSGVRARPGAQLRPQPGRLRPGLPFPTRHRHGLQRVRRAARLPGGGRRPFSGPRAADSEAQQPRRAARRKRPALRGDQRRGRRAAARLRRGRLHDLPRLIRGADHVRATPRNRSRGQGQGAGGRRVVLSARLGPEQGGRDRHRRRGVRGTDRGADGRPRHQGQTAEQPRRIGRGAEGVPEASRTHHHTGRARPARRAERLRRQADRHLLGRRGQGRRGVLRRGARYP